MKKKMSENRYPACAGVFRAKGEISRTRAGAHERREGEEPPSSPRVFPSALCED